MSKFAAIDCAVRLQLAAENKGFAEYQKIMSGTTGYDYTPSTMQAFLFAVSTRLRLDTPGYDFSWENLQIANCLTASLEILLQYIHKATLTME